jgi:hypothetical protein
MVANKTVGNQKIIIKKFKVLEEIEKSHILFIAHWKSDDFDSILKSIGTNNTLIVTDKDGLIQKGASINFFRHMKEDKELLEFEIKVANAEERNIKVSPNLVSMADKKY